MKIRASYMFVIVGVISLLLLYTGYWFYARSVIEQEVAAWIEDQEAAGYEIDYADLRIVGFPYRFQISASSPDIRAPEMDGGWHARWQTLNANALPYDFSHWIVQLEGPMLIETDRAATSVLELTADGARISLVSNEDGETVRVGAELDQLVVNALSGPAPDLQSVDMLRLTGQVEEGDLLRMRLEASGLGVSSDALEPQISQAFGDHADLARLDITVTQWSALAREGDAAAWSRSEGQVQIARAELEWGPAHVTGVGDFTLDRQARPDGRLSLSIADPDALADALVRGGLIPEENEQALRLATMLAPRSEDGVSLPFRIREGGIYLGPVRLGDLED